MPNNTQQATNNAERTTELREALNTHRQEAQYLLSKDMFYTAKVEIDRCIRISRKIDTKLIKEP